MKIEWKRKLSSRKFWVAVGAWVTSLLTAFNVSDSAIAQAAVIISGIGALAVYMLAEAYADAKNVQTAAQQTNEQIEVPGFTCDDK